MSRRLYKITKKFDSISPNSDPEQAVASDQIDLSIELSKKLGKTIRQGNSFRIAGASAHIVPHNTNYDLDSGLAAKVRLGYCPVTKHTRKGWNLMFSHWAKQKRLAGAMGKHMRYDDFELAIHSDYITGRTSTMFTEGLNDETDEKVCIYTDADDGHNPNDHIGLQAYYNKKFPIPSAGELPNDGWTTDWAPAKNPKYQQYFPNREYMGLSAIMSAQDYHDPDIAFDDHWMTPVASYNENMFFDNSHISVLAGVMSCAVYVLPESDADVIEDELDLYVTLWVEGWSSLVYRKRKSSRRTYRRRGKKKSYKKKRWYRRGYYRRR